MTTNQKAGLPLDELRTLRELRATSCRSVHVLRGRPLFNNGRPPEDNGETIALSGFRSLKFDTRPFPEQVISRYGLTHN